MNTHTGDKGIWFKPVLPFDYFVVLLQLAAERGINPQELSAAAGLNEADLHQLHHPKVTPEAFALAAERLMSLAEDDSLCVEAGLRMGPTVHGNMGLAILCSANLDQAFSLMQQYFAVRLPSVRVERAVSDEYHSIYLHTTLSDLPMGSLFTELLMACTYRAICVLLGNTPSDLLIEFPHPKPSYMDRVESKLPRLEFESKHLCLKIPSRYLNRDLVMPNPVELARARLRCEEELQTLSSQPSGISEKVYMIIMSESGGCLPTLLELASRLHMSESTLKRRLAAEGLNYRDMTEQYKVKRAEKFLLTSDLSVERVAETLGFASSGSFSRAFKKWKGCSPAEYRVLNKTQDGGER